MVFVRLQPYKYETLHKQGKHKLQPRFYGPYQVCMKVGEVAHALDIPNKERLNNVFHVSCSKKVGEDVVTQIYFC